MEIQNTLGYYHLSGRQGIAQKRWENYFYGVERERLIRKFLPFLRHLPFIRGVAVGGSQSLGQQREDSDIDLFIATEEGFLWLTRTLVSVYLQIFGLRRHGRKIKNRFCLNHYVSGPKLVDREKNLYKAMEYLRLRPIIYPQVISEFLEKNKAWILIYFPNFYIDQALKPQSFSQKILEPFFRNPLGSLLEKCLGLIQKLKIRQDEFTFVLPDELSFHPHSQHRALLNKFFTAL